MSRTVNTLAPVLTLGTFIVAATAIWLPSGSATQVASANTIQQAEDRLAKRNSRLTDLIEVTTQRPVFHASRRPVQAPEAPKAPEPVLTLLGVISEDNSETRAFVKISTSETLYRIAKGETVGRWRVLEIGTESIMVSKDGAAPYSLKIGR